MLKTINDNFKLNISDYAIVDFKTFVDVINVLGVVADIEYSADVCLKLLLPEDKADAFSQRTADVTAGASELEITGEEFKPVRIR